MFYKLFEPFLFTPWVSNRCLNPRNFPKPHPRTLQTKTLHPHRCLSDCGVQNDSQNVAKTITKRSLNLDWNSSLFTSLSGTPNEVHNLRKHLYSFSKTSISTNRPFPFAHGFGTNKSSKTNPKPLQHRFQKASPKLIEIQHHIS